MSAGFDPESFTSESRRSWDAAAPHYERISETHFGPITAEFARFCSLEAGQLVLDVACGPGTLTFEAADRVAPAGKVIGVDLSSSMLKLAAARVKALPAVEFREMNAEALDLADSLFDRVLCQLGLMLFARPHDALSEMARVARPGGLVCCLVQGSAEGMLWTSLINRSLLKHAPELKVPGAPGLYAFGAPGAIESAFSLAGLKEIETRRLSGSFAFPSPEAYWQAMTEGAGRTGATLKQLSEEKRRAVAAEVLALAAGYPGPGGIALPFEFVLAKGRRA